MNETIKIAKKKEKESNQLMMTSHIPKYKTAYMSK